MTNLNPLRRLSRAAAIVPAILCAMPVLAQRGSNDWMTAGFDVQRSNWVRGDNKISLSSVAKPGFQLVWKHKFENAARQLNTSTPPSLIDFYIGYKGFRTLGFFGVAADRAVAIDVDMPRVEWEVPYKAPSGAPAGTLDCPGGMTAGVTRPTITSYPAVPSGRGPGRGTPAKSGVGLPDEGAVTIRPSAPPPPPPPAKPAAGQAAAFNPFAPRVQWALALGADGKLHFHYISNGHEPMAAAPFVPANANAVGLMAYDNIAYVSTTGSCNGVPNGVWALDFDSKKVTSWKSDTAVAGTNGAAAGPDGTLYAAAGRQLTALAPKTLAVKGSYGTGGDKLTSSPVVFEFKGRDLIAVASDKGQLHLVDAANLSGGALDKSATFTTPDVSIGALASWQDPAGTRWVLAASNGKAAASGFASNGAVSNGAIVAFKVVEKAGKPAFEQAWASRDMTSPLTPIVVSGVVFAVASGEHRPAGKMTAAQIAQKSSPAVLYALDPATGKEIWSSGNTITSFVHSGGLAAGGSRIYVATYDGTQYVFGFPLEI